MQSPGHLQVVIYQQAGLGNIVAGLVGAWLGQSLLGSWGPSLAGMALIPSILGAVILVVIVSIIFGMRKKG